MSRAGRERRIRNAMEIRAMVPAVMNRTFPESNDDRMDREDGFVTKNSHSMEA